MKSISHVKQLFVSHFIPIARHDAHINQYGEK